jgi:hypothetical protein
MPMDDDKVKPVCGLMLLILITTFAISSHLTPEGRGVDMFSAVGSWLSAVGTLLAVGVALWPIYKEHRESPKLEIDFAPGRDIRRQTQTAGRIKIPGNSRWLRVRVMNGNGRRSAKNCRVYLTRVQLVVPHGLQDVVVNDGLPVANGRKTTPRHVRPGQVDMQSRIYAGRLPPAAEQFLRFLSVQ